MDMRVKLVIYMQDTWLVKKKKSELMEILNPGKTGYSRRESNAVQASIQSELQVY